MSSLQNRMLHCMQVILRKLLWCRVLCIRKDSWGWINDKSNFDGVQDINVDWLEFGTLVGYMESHDEERTMFKAQSYSSFL